FQIIRNTIIGYLNIDRKIPITTMKRVFIVLLTYLTIVFVSSCSFNYSEDYFNDIEQVEPTADLLLNNFNNNLVITSPVNVNYDYDSGDIHRLFEIRIYIDDVEIKNTSETRGNFYIDADNLSSGNHILKIEYIFSSGSN